MLLEASWIKKIQKRWFWRGRQDFSYIGQKSPKIGKNSVCRQCSAQIFATQIRTVSLKKLIQALNWEVLLHAAYSPDAASFDYHIFPLMGHALAEQRLYSYKIWKNGLPSCLESQMTSLGSQVSNFFGEASINCLRDGKNV